MAIHNCERKQREREKSFRLPKPTVFFVQRESALKQLNRPFDFPFFRGVFCVGRVVNLFLAVFSLHSSNYFVRRATKETFRDFAK